MRTLIVLTLALTACAVEVEVAYTTSPGETGGSTPVLDAGADTGAVECGPIIWPCQAYSTSPPAPQPCEVYTAPKDTPCDGGTCDFNGNCIPTAPVPCQVCVSPDETLWVSDPPVGVYCPADWTCLEACEDPGQLGDECHLGVPCSCGAGLTCLTMGTPTCHKI